MYMYKCLCNLEFKSQNFTHHTLFIEINLMHKFKVQNKRHNKLSAFKAHTTVDRMAFY